MYVIDEVTRHAIHGHLAGQMGDDLAGAFMSLLPRVPWEEFATKHDLTVLRDDLVGIKHDMVALEVRLNERLDDKLAATGAGLRTEMHTGIAGLRTEMNTGIAGLRTEMHQGFRRMTVWVASLQVVTLGAVAAVAARLG